MKKLLGLAAAVLILGYAAAIYTVPPEGRMMVSAIALGLMFGLTLLARRARGEGGSR